MKSVLIINPLASANYIHEQLERFKITSIAIYTINIETISDYLKPKAEWFTQQIYLPENISALEIINKLAQYQFDYVINGLESSIYIADQLTEYYTPELSNNIKTSDLRTNKYLIHKWLEAADLANIKQTRFILGQDNIQDPIYKKLTYPCFVKPLEGVASIGTRKINNYGELVLFFNDLDIEFFLQKLHAYLHNKQEIIFLICEYIEGDEYIVDTFSYKGNHYISSIQRNYKYKQFSRYKLIETELNLVNKITNYIKKILTVSGFNNGFAHIEIFLRKRDQEPVLIEINPRISGIAGYCNYLAMEENLNDQIFLLKKALFEEEMPDLYIPPITNTCAQLCLFNFSLMPVNELKNKLSAYKTVKKARYLKPDTYIAQTMPYALTDAVALIICKAENKEMLLSDVKEIISIDDKREKN